MRFFKKKKDPWLLREMAESRVGQEIANISLEVRKCSVSKK